MCLFDNLYFDLLLKHNGFYYVLCTYPNYLPKLLELKKYVNVQLEIVHCNLHY
jgi:hypothetical protein